MRMYMRLCTFVSFSKTRPLRQKGSLQVFGLEHDLASVKQFAQYLRMQRHALKLDSGLTVEERWASFAVPVSSMPSIIYVPTGW